MKSTLIIKEAKEVKNFIEKNKVLPKYCTIDGNQYSIYTVANLFGRLLNGRDIQNFAVLTVQAPNKQIKTSINEKILIDDYLDMNRRFVNYIAKNGRIPAYITSVKSKKQIQYDLYIYCLCKIITYWAEHSNTLPKYCEFNSNDIKNTKTTTTNTQKSTNTYTSNCTNPYTSSPHYTSNGCNRLGQCTGYWCGPHSIHQAIRKFGITKYTEKQIASWCGTTTAGTGHPGINTGIAKISNMSGVKLSVTWKNFSDMGSTTEERFKTIAKILCQPNKAIIWHIAYINGGNSTNGTHFGHYECLDKINISTKYVRALNSLGNKKTDGSYTGKLQDRKYDIQSYFARNTPGGQAALCIITKK